MEGEGGGESHEEAGALRLQPGWWGRGGGWGARPTYLLTVSGDRHAQGVLTAGLCSAYHSQNLPEGQRGHVHEQEDPHDFGDPVGNGASFVKHHCLYLPKQPHLSDHDIDGRDPQPTQC